MLTRTTVFYIDFLKHSGLIEDVPDHIVDGITEKLQEENGVDIFESAFVREVYNSEINRFKRGIYGALEQEDPAEFRKHELRMLAGYVDNAYEHAQRSLKFLQSSRQLSFVIALDNVDQHEATFQERIFVVGQAIAETWPCTVFMALRPDTFHESRKTGTLAAYQPRVFTVSPPRSDNVVTKRLEFARKELVEYGRMPGFPAGLTLDSESLLIYIDVLLDAFESNRQLIELVDNLSSGNTRRALDFISTFVGSGYVQTSRILQAHKNGNSYVVPLHEFIRAILNGDHKYYDPNTSHVPNIFSVGSSEGKEHFLLAMALAEIETAGDGKPGGFTDLGTVYSKLQRLEFIAEQIDHHLERARRFGLTEENDHGESGKLIRVTPAGAYLYKVLVSNFSYIDAIVVDTPILDINFRTQIRDVHDISDRISRAEVFISYLHEMWKFAEETIAFDWRLLSTAWDKSLSDVKRGATRAAERRRNQH
ncbi:hypothetical protein OH799_35330 [Nocardia sp. NBC_00881]|uniref:hypothetical protein n=1 Tax=Nocardia sp. NBC_00881 TaxID=2975995 RepID=UPI00386C6B58|nr:hypothetical protein OH799_35330 [Nocardia sp. NBC_00881]